MRLAIKCTHEGEGNVLCNFVESDIDFYVFRCPVCKREVVLKLEVDGS